MYGVYAGRVGRRGREDLLEVERAEEGEDAEDPEDEAEVADAVDDERLLAGVGRELLLVVVPDQQVRAQAHAFPPDEEHEEVAAEHEDEHREHEEVQVREEAPVALLVPHVARGVDVDEETHERDEQQHQGRQRIDPQRHVHVPVAHGPGICPTAWLMPSGIQRHSVMLWDGALREGLQPDVEDGAEGQQARDERAADADDRVQALEGDVVMSRIVAGVRGRVGRRRRRVRVAAGAAAVAVRARPSSGARAGRPRR